MGEKWKAPPIWEGDDCWILGGGTSVPVQFGVPEDVIQAVMRGKQSPSAYASYLLKHLENRHVIGINNAYMIGNWIDVEFFGDKNWYLNHRRTLAEFPKLKVSCAAYFGTIRYEGVKFLPKDPEHVLGINTDPTMVSWNNNSGTAAISLARHFGVRRVFLLGFDMCLGTNQFSHWHGSHNPNREAKLNLKRRMSSFDRHLRSFSAVARDAKLLGLEIYNVSLISKINEFPKITLEEALAK